MSTEERIINKIIPIETIIEVANYLENQKDQYKRLFENDIQKNANLKFSEQIYQYKVRLLKTQYTIIFKDGKEISQEDYNWFLDMLGRLKLIKGITLHFCVYYSSNNVQKEHYTYMNSDIWIHFLEDSARIIVKGTNTEEKINKLFSDLRETIENNDERYNKTIKNRKIRIQSFCFSIGFIISYIIYIILIANKSNFPIEYSNYLNNKFVMIFGQWFLSAIIGNILGYPIMINLYRNILPKAKYSHYSKSSRKSIYVDNLEDYISHCEVQIGKFTSSGKSRNLIEKIYKITKIIVIIQILISSLLFILFK